MKVHNLFILIFVILVASCKQQEANLSPEELASRDSLALRVAVMPVMDCFPIYYACQAGLVDTTTLNLRLHTFKAQMDVDTALQKGVVDLAYSDLIRSLRLAPTVDNLHIILRGHEKWSLICQKGKRVKKENQLKERMIATCRLSAVDYWCDAMIDTLKTAEDDIYRPQINDVQLRAEMTRTNLIDAALMPWPYDQWMLRQGLRRLCASQDKDPKFSCWVTRMDTIPCPEKETYLHLFVKTYNQAVQEINEHADHDAILRVLTQVYSIPAEVADSIDIPSLLPVDFPKEEELDLATEWLQSKNRMPEKLDKSRLIQTKYLR